MQTQLPLLLHRSFFTNKTIALGFALRQLFVPCLPFKLGNDMREWQFIMHKYISSTFTLHPSPKKHEQQQQQQHFTYR